MKKYLLISLIIMSLAIEKALCEVPVITDWSSSGGNTQNKDNDQDIMYLITHGDNLTFTVTVNQTVDYEWQVNKSSETSVNSNVFNWTVPGEGGIWEIHCKVWNGSNEEAHKEWVLSTLTEEEAPDFFDYFADLTHNERTEKDPWNRDLKNWVDYPVTPPIADASKGFMRPSGTLDGRPQPRVDVSSILCGTWKFRYRFPDGNTGAWGFSFYYVYQSGITYNSYYGKCADTHHHCSVPRGLQGKPFSIDYDGGGWNEDGKWHQVTIIRTTDTWVYMYVDDIFEFYVQDHLTNLAPDKILIDMKRYQGHEIQFDCFEIYQNDIFFPKNEIKYQEYIWNYYVNNYYHYPEKRWGIVIRGKGITLNDVANAVGSNYLEKTGGNTYICKTDLVFDNGCEFKMDNETLKFRSTFDGERHLVIKYGAEIDINNSLITSENDFYYIWNNACSTTHFAAMGGQILTGWIEEAYGLWPINHAGYVRFAVNNSTIDKTTHIFFDSPYELKITNTNFTNLDEIDIGNYSVTGSHLTTDRKEREWYKGNKSFFVVVDELNVNNFDISNITFSGKSNPINVTLSINALRDKLNIYNVDLQDANIVLKKVLPQTHGQSHTLGWYKQHDVNHDGDGIDSKIGLVNCKFKNLIVADDKTWGVRKYYLDVKVVDSNGSSVSGANITVINGVDNINYPAENMDESINWWNPDVPDYDPEWGWQKFYLHRHITQGITHQSTVTGSDGHTFLPSDSENTLVLSDYLQDKDGKQNFTYTITASKDGKTASMSGLDIDESWYRENPSVPTKTVVMVLGGQSYVSDDTIKPTLSLVVPQDGAKVFGRVPIEINAIDNFGVTKVGLYINDILTHTFYNTPYEWIWDTKETPKGEYKIKVVAYDTNDNSSEEEITVKVIKVEGIVTYPNPYVKGKSSIERISFANLPKETTIRIYTVSGELVKVIKHKDIADGGSKEWDISGIASGIYMYCIESSEGMKKGKVSIIK